MTTSVMQPVVAILLLAIAIAPKLAVSASSAMNTTCSAITSGPQEYCAGVLSAYPEAVAATDAHGVAVAAINIITNKAVSTLRVTTDLLDELNKCRRMYNGLIESLGVVLVDFRAGRFQNASYGMAMNATGVAESCDIQMFEGNAHKDPISKENGENWDLVDLAQYIVDLIASKRLGDSG